MQPAIIVIANAVRMSSSRGAGGPRGSSYAASAAR